MNRGEEDLVGISIAQPGLVAQRLHGCPGGGQGQVRHMRPTDRVAGTCMGDRWQVQYS